MSRPPGRRRVPRVRRVAGLRLGPRSRASDSSPIWPLSWSAGLLVFCLRRRADAGPARPEARRLPLARALAADRAGAGLHRAGPRRRPGGARRLRAAASSSLNFWATWCEPCIREWPQLDRLAERFAGRDDVVILAISRRQRPDPGRPLPRAHEPHAHPREGAVGPEAELNNAFGTDKLPDTYFIDRAGELVHAFINVRDWGRPAAYHCVESMLARR